jgi:hypothetical protein
MEAFNLSMLGKQSWKLLSDSSSLLTRVLKAKYFPRRNFFDAPLGHNPSYTWRSLRSTQHLLTLGHRWKIGDGSKINVWNMPWLHNLPSLKPSTPPPPNYEDLKVSDLMIPGSTYWNHNFVHSLFNDGDAPAILSTPLYNRQREDSRIWKATNDGSYSVKSTYRICIDIFHESLQVQNSTYWQLLWHLHVPPAYVPFFGVQLINVYLRGTTSPNGTFLALKHVFVVTFWLKIICIYSLSATNLLCVGISLVLTTSYANCYLAQTISKYFFLIFLAD